MLLGTGSRITAMDHLDIDEARTWDFGEGVDYRSLRDVLGLQHLAINRYRLSPATRLPWGLHAHFDQEEVFLVVKGTMVFDTLDGPVTVEAGEAIRFAPGDFQAGHNPGDDPAECFAIGAPPDSEDIRIPKPCASCGAPALTITMDADELTCPACGTATPASCIRCGEDAREIRIEDGTLVDRCRACDDREPIQRTS